MPALLSKGQAKEKTAHRKGHVSLNKLDDLSSPGSAECCRQMPVITGKNSDLQKPAMSSQLEWGASTWTADYGK